MTCKSCRAKLNDHQRKAVYWQFYAWYRTPRGFRETQEALTERLNGLLGLNKSTRTYLRIYEDEHYDELPF